MTVNSTSGEAATFLCPSALEDLEMGLRASSSSSDQPQLSTSLNRSQSPLMSSTFLPSPSIDLLGSSKHSLAEPQHIIGLSSLSPLLLQSSSLSLSSLSSASTPPPSAERDDPCLEDEMRLQHADAAYYTWLYTVVYELYVSGVFFYLLPYALIPILNLQLLVAIKQRRDETRRISLKNQHQMSSQKPTDMEDGLTMIVLGITVCFFICCVIPAIYNVTQIAEVPPTTKLSTYLLIASDTMLCVNASTDFFFYCLLGRRFRNVFIYLFCTKRYLAKRRNLAGSRYGSRGQDSYYHSV